MKPGETQLRHSLHRLLHRPPHPPLQPDPTSGFEVSIATRLDSLTKQVDHLRTRVNWLLTFIVGAALLQLLAAFTN